jgi:hypothetical protein
VESCRHRRIASTMTTVYLSHHRLYANVWHRSVTLTSRQSLMVTLPGLSIFLAADRRRDLR